MKCAKEDLLLYAVTDRHWLNRDGHYMKWSKKVWMAV